MLAKIIMNITITIIIIVLLFLKKSCNPFENHYPDEPHGGMIKILPYWLLLDLLFY